ncbi:adenylyltransferase, partial [Kouleothrix aurantiaca]
MTAPSTDQNTLITPYGGALVNLLVAGDERAALIAEAGHLPTLQLSARALCDLELIATGGFSPLDRFMGQADYERVLGEMRLADGTLFPLPITLTAKRDAIPSGTRRLALRDARNNLLAVMDLDEVFAWDPKTEAAQALGTTDARHPLVSEMIRWGDVCVSAARLVSSSWMRCSG